MDRRLMIRNTGVSVHHQSANQVAAVALKLGGLSFFLGLSLFAYLVISYIGVFQRWHYFGGYLEPQFEMWRLVSGVAAAGILSVYVALQRSWFSQVALAITLALSILPSIAITSVTGDQNLQISAIVAGFIFTSVYTLVNAGNWAILPKDVAFSLKSFRAMLILAGAPAILVVFASYEIKVPTSLTLDIYELRARMREESDTRLAGYAYGMTAKLLVAALVSWATVYRSLAVGVVAVVLAMAMFLVGGHKSILGVAMVAAVIARWSGAVQRYHGVFILIPILIVVFATLVFSILTDSFLLHDLTLRRVMHLPGLLTAHYFQYFQAFPNLLSGTAIAPADLPFVIGAEIFGRPEMRANVNGYANSYAQIGFAGIVFFSAAYSMIMKYLSDVMAVCYDLRAKNFVLAISMIYLWALSESALTTTFVTHGLGVFCVMLGLSLRSLRN